MLTFVLLYRTAVEKFTANLANDSRELELTAEEWKIVTQLSEVLMALKHATEFFSRATPNLAHVILVMDNINDRLTAQANNDAYSPAIRAALGIAKKTLNRYYSRTDDSEAYRIAMILHPKYKLNYFKSAKWEQVWVDTAEELIRTEYRDKYEEDEVSGSDTAEVRFHHFIF
ncbi:hypothetical protein HYPSUDRAFT_142979 [Hypholoma sublateritium FD-334 SS-4]|uniref:hAT-like transposase RNase-H fold domain-containing protein n=1 Tax=Hypholoma sublateritium (strain FD-334 SS-4) TaxID=945553 RepID=A0A0D2NTS0_HYPSF|nr:hypothetical protein HYPSUDRAFT_142979 [Hypholoma sublateritium FD-334 SS-4]